MSSSSSAPAPARRAHGRVLRDAAVAVAPGDPVLGIDLARSGLERLDPARVDAAVDAGRAEGYAAGFAAGEAAGRDAAAGAWSARLAAVVAAAEAEIAEALTALHSLAEATAQRVAGVAFEVAEAVVGRELALALEPGADAVARALRGAPAAAELALHLHPDDAAALAVDALPAGRAVSVVADPSIAVGDCIARSGATTVDARVAPALERVRAVLGGDR